MGRLSEWNGQKNLQREIEVGLEDKFSAPSDAPSYRVLRASLARIVPHDRAQNVDRDKVEESDGFKGSKTSNQRTAAGHLVVYCYAPIQKPVSFASAGQHSTRMKIRAVTTRKEADKEVGESGA